MARRQLEDFDFSLFQAGLANVGFVLFLIAAFWSLHVISWHFGDLDRRIARLPLPAVAAIGVLCLALFFILWPLEQVPYIYFQF